MKKWETEIRNSTWSKADESTWGHVLYVLIWFSMSPVHFFFQGFASLVQLCELLRNESWKSANLFAAHSCMSKIQVIGYIRICVNYVSPMSTGDYFLASAVKTNLLCGLSTYRINIFSKQMFYKFLVSLVSCHGMHITLEGTESAYSIDSLMPCRVGYQETDSASSSSWTLGRLACTYTPCTKDFSQITNIIAVNMDANFFIYCCHFGYIGVPLSK